MLRCQFQITWQTVALIKILHELQNKLHQISQANKLIAEKMPTCENLALQTPCTCIEKPRGNLQ